MHMPRNEAHIKYKKDGAAPVFVMQKSSTEFMSYAQNPNIIDKRLRYRTRMCDCVCARSIYVKSSTVNHSTRQSLTNN